MLHLPGAAVVPVDASGRILLVRHAHTGVWGVPGGVVEIDESPERAAVRETIEETVLRPGLEELVGVFGCPEYRVVYPNGDQASFVVAVYEARLDHAEPVPHRRRGHRRQVVGPGVPCDVGIESARPRAAGRRGIPAAERRERSP